MLDGTIARATNSTSEFGARLDSISDLIFYAVMIVKFFPILLGISVVVISVIGTVNHPNLDLDAEEMQISQKSARYVLLIECGILCIAWYLRIDNSYVYCMMLAVILCGFLMILAKLLEQEVKRDEA